MFFVNKLKQFYDNNKYVLCSGGAALLIIMLIYFCFELIPFGDKTIYRMDLYHQYGPLFSELYDRITNGGSLLYSWNSGLGSAFIGNFFNYLSSPISFIIILFGHKNTFEAVAAMIAIKSVLSSMSMAYYLKSSRKTNDFSICAFGVVYAFSAYFIAYYWNVMWLDSMYILPLVVLGIERIIDTGKVRTYIFALVWTIFSNYYIGFMICIFSCLYFLYYFASSFSRLKQKRDLLDNKSLLDKCTNSFFLHSGTRFALASATAGIILLFMLVPILHVLRSCSATSGTAPEEQKFYYDIFDFLANHLASLEPTIRSSGEDVLPNVYCGILTVILIPLYLFSKRISNIEKVASVVLLAILYFSFNNNYLNYLWHGLHFPNDLPYRQSFMYSFLLVIMAHKAFMFIHDFDKRQILAVSIGIVAFIVMVQKITSKNVTDTTIYLSIAFVVFFTIVLGLINSKKAQYYALSVLLLCTTITEAIMASTQHYVANQTKTAFAEDYDAYKALQYEVDSNDKALFYRCEMSYLRARMDPCWYGYNGVSTFSSMAYEKTANMKKYIGLFGNKINSYTYNPQTPIYNAMFSVKYIYDKNNYVSEGDYYSFVDSNDTFTAYENNYMLNIAYPVSDDILNWDASNGENPVDVQSEYFYLATGVKDVFNYLSTDAVAFSYNPMNVSTSDFQLRTGLESGSLSIRRVGSSKECILTTTITVQNNENTYIYLQSRNVKDISIFTPTMSRKISVADGFILDLGQHRAGDLIDIEIELKDDTDYASVKYIPFTVNKEKFVEGYEKLKSGQLEYTTFTDTFISGNFTAENDEVLYTSIPYDSGWNIYIDGNKVSEENIVKISDALIGVKVDEGNHEISFEYSPKYFKLSQTISVVFTLLLLIVAIMKELKLFIFKKQKPNLWQRADIALNEQNSTDKDDIEITFNE